MKCNLSRNSNNNNNNVADRQTENHMLFQSARHGNRKLKVNEFSSLLEHKFLCE